jgi:hypothetical protein
MTGSASAIGCGVLRFLALSARRHAQLEYVTDVDYAFRGCSLTSVTSIGDPEFYGCGGLPAATAFGRCDGRFGRRLPRMNSPMPSQSLHTNRRPAWPLAISVLRWSAVGVRAGDK